jgi:chitin synthase
LGILGWQFNVTNAKVPSEFPVFDILKKGSGQDISNFFTRKNEHIRSCTKKGLPDFAIVSHEPCADEDEFCILKDSINNQSLEKLNMYNTTRIVGYDWDQLTPLKNYIVVDGNVLNLEPYIATYPDPTDDLMDKIIRKVLNSDGKDATRYLLSKPNMKNAVDCIVDKYFAGKIDKETIGCFTSELFLNVSLVVILGIVITRFLMACVFNWFVSPRLALRPAKFTPTSLPTNRVASADNIARMIMNKIGNNLFCVMLVTCYSEGEVGIRTTCESIAATDYPDDRKLLFLICDGIITGSGNSKSTPDICVEMMELSPEFKDPEPMSYIAVAAGAKQLNMAKVYAGHFSKFNLNAFTYLYMYVCMYLYIYIYLFIF